jgi:hypothetical protein
MENQIEYTPEQREAFILDSLLTTRAMLNVLLEQRANELAAAKGTRWTDELKQLGEAVENERQIIIGQLKGKGLENTTYTDFAFKPR